MTKPLPKPPQPDPPPEEVAIRLPKKQPTPKHVHPRLKRQFFRRYDPTRQPLSDKPTFGQLMAYARFGAGISQRQLAKLLDCNREWVQRVEINQQFPTPLEMEDLRKHIGEKCPTMEVYFAYRFVWLVLAWDIDPNELIRQMKRIFLMHPGPRQFKLLPHTC